MTSSKNKPKLFTWIKSTSSHLSLWTRKIIFSFLENSRFYLHGTKIFARNNKIL